MILKTPTPQLYFLPYLFLVAAICVALYKGIKNWAFYVFSMLMLLVYLWLEFPFQVHGNWRILLGMYGTAFLHGIYYRNHFEKPRQQVCSTLYLFILSLIGWYAGNSPILFFLVVTPLLYHLLSIIGNPTFLVWLGGLSGGIYVWHEPVIHTGFKVLFYKLGISGLGYALGVFLLTLAFSILLTRTISRYNSLRFLRLH